MSVYRLVALVGIFPIQCPVAAQQGLFGTFCGEDIAPLLSVPCMLLLIAVKLTLFLLPPMLWHDMQLIPPPPPAPFPRAGLWNVNP